jgi:uncharacterized FAD-dependent dehydrogenase
VGAGPAGLATASSLVKHGDFDFLLIERGKALSSRQRDQELDIAAGIGGAGLFSDGKFSFFPSASMLWVILDETQLRRSYAWLKELLEQFDVQVPEFKQNLACIQNNDFKGYPSYYLDFAQRYALIEKLSAQFTYNIRYDTEIIDIVCDNGIYYVKTSAGSLAAKNLVLASGRMGPAQLNNYSLAIPQKFQRIEIGVRLEGHYQHPFFYDLMQNCEYPDPKHLFHDEEQTAISWRTFCFCQRGEIVNSRHGEHVALSGRADCKPTQLSNIGFNTRIKLNSFSGQLPKADKQFSIPLLDILDTPEILEQYFTKQTSHYVAKGLFKLQQRFKSITADNTINVLGPTIEGVGEYPIVDRDLRVREHNIFIPGDAVGLFRGITAALLSGYYVGQQLSHHSRNASIKMSSASCYV